MIFEELLKKYDVPVPRYTSYPTVPFWRNQDFETQRWLESVKRIFNETNQTKGISVYVHLPFCESLCTYCACNTRITKNHAVEQRYGKAVLQEWQRYLDLFGETPVLHELHLGGGTPTFFSPENLDLLLSGIIKLTRLHDPEFSFEGHPNNTTREHLAMLYKSGFRRVSFGVQDLNQKVQETINRVQPFENVKRVTEQSREIGYSSVSFDLIYGLPYQTMQSVTETVEKIITLKPDRIAFYSYAHVPWIKPGQRGYEDSDLPGDVVKRSLYEMGRKLFLEAGYVEIGMDHFALPNDALALALKNETLHRNFMGYTTSSTDLLIGLGASSISDAHYGYAQNLKKVEDYEAQISNGEWALAKGHLQSQNDLLIKNCILEIACKGKLSGLLLRQIMDNALHQKLQIMEEEGIIELNTEGLQVTSLGKVFLRNICSQFDPTIGVKPAQTIFSKAI